MIPVMYLLVPWAVGVAVGLAATAVITGIRDNTDNRDSKEDDISVGVGVSLFWPLVVAIGLTFAPFYALHKFGQWYGRRM